MNDTRGQVHYTSQNQTLGGIKNYLGMNETKENGPYLKSINTSQNKNDKDSLIAEGWFRLQNGTKLRNEQLNGNREKRLRNTPVQAEST
jgi:hypothetical protein